MWKKFDIPILEIHFDEINFLVAKSFKPTQPNPVTLETWFKGMILPC